MPYVVGPMTLSQTWAHEAKRHELVSTVGYELAEFVLQQPDGVIKQSAAAAKVTAGINEEGCGLWREAPTRRSIIDEINPKVLRATKQFRTCFTLAVSTLPPLSQKCRKPIL